MRRTLLLLCLPAVLALAACGGDDRLSTSEYRSQARTICTDADRAQERIRQPTRATSDAIVDYFKRLLAANDRATKRFGALEPPEELQGPHDDALRTNNAAATELRRIVKELEGGGDPRQVLTGAQSRLERLSSQSGDAAKRLGVPECADE